jgi:hypothetical protein
MAGTNLKATLSGKGLQIGSCLEVGPDYDGAAIELSPELLADIQQIDIKSGASASFQFSGLQANVKRKLKINLADNSKCHLYTMLSGQQPDVSLQLEVNLGKDSFFERFQLFQALAKTSSLQSRGEISGSAQKSPVSLRWQESCQVNLLGSGSEAYLSGLYDLSNLDQVSLDFLVNHKASHTKSDAFYKGVLRDKAQASFVDRAVIDEKIVGIEARQVNRNLLLSKQAVINTKPELEIYSDDVKATHGATVGQLDETAKFYLQSRGLSAEQAEDILIEAFAKDILGRAKSKAIVI